MAVTTALAPDMKRFLQLSVHMADNKLRLASLKIEDGLTHDLLQFPVWANLRVLILKVQVKYQNFPSE